MLCYTTISYIVLRYPIDYRGYIGYRQHCFAVERNCNPYGCRSSCESGFLRISDHRRLKTDWLPPPTTLCGSYNNSHGGKLRVRRRTRTPFALVEFKYDRARKEGGFEYDVTFINKGIYSEWDHKTFMRLQVPTPSFLTLSIYAF